MKTARTAPDFSPLAFLRSVHIDSGQKNNRRTREGRKLLERFALRAIEPDPKDGGTESLSLEECAQALDFLCNAKAIQGPCGSHDELHAADGYRTVLQWLAKEVRRNAKLNGAARIPGN